MLIDFYFFYATRNSYTISNDLVENKQSSQWQLRHAAVPYGPLAGFQCQDGNESCQPAGGACSGVSVHPTDDLQECQPLVADLAM